MAPMQNDKENSHVYNDKDGPPYSRNASNTKPNQYNDKNDFRIKNGAANTYQNTAHAYNYMMMDRLLHQKPESPSHKAQQSAPISNQSLSDPSLDDFLLDMNDPSSQSTEFASTYLPLTHHHHHHHHHHHQQPPQQEQDQQHPLQPQNVHSLQQQRVQPISSAITSPANVDPSVLPVMMTGLQYDFYQESNLSSLSSFLDILMSPFSIPTMGSSNSSSYNDVTIATPHSFLSDSYFPSSSSDIVTEPINPSAHNSPTSSNHYDTTMVKNSNQVEQHPMATSPSEEYRQEPKKVAGSSTPSSSPTPKERKKPTTPTRKHKTAKPSAMYRTHSYETVMNLSDFNVDSTAYANANDNNSKNKKGQHSTQSHSSISSEPLDHKKVMEVLRAKILRSKSSKQQTTSTISASTAASIFSSSGANPSKASPEPTVRPPNTCPCTGVLVLNLKNRRRKASVPKKAGNSSKSATPDGSNGSSS